MNENETLSTVIDTDSEDTDMGTEIEDELTTPPDEGKANEEPQKEEPIDYVALMQSDVEALKAEFPELAGIRDVTDLNNPLRYAALRDMGLSPEEAYLATAKRANKDTRSHLKAAYGKSAGASGVTMSPFELAAARDLFPGKNDAELQKLYRRVSK